MKKIKRIKLETDNLSDPELLIYGRKVETKLNNSTTFDTLDSKTTMLSTQLGVLDVRIKDFDQKEKGLETARTLLTQQREEVINILASLGAGVEQIAEGETTVVLASGFDLQAERAAVGPLVAPENLRLSIADMDGELKARWNKVRGGRSYVVEYSLEGSGAWIHAGVSTKVSFTLTGLESGKKYRIRVRAIGAAGAGPWSDEAVKMAA